MLGYSYRYGLGVPRNPRKGFALELKAAKKGVREAQFAVGFCLSRGVGVRADHEQAPEWSRKAARKGDEDAAHNVGYVYNSGRGTEKDAKKATYWYKRAEELRKDRESRRTCLPALGRGRSPSL